MGLDCPGVENTLRISYTMELGSCQGGGLVGWPGRGGGVEVKAGCVGYHITEQLTFCCVP